MVQKTRAIILHSIKYGDSSLIVHCFTEEWGRKSFLLKGVRKSRKGNKANLFQPLFLLRLEVYYKEGRDLQWIKEASFAEGIPSFGLDVRKSSQALFLTEMMMKVLKEEEKNPMLFHFLHHSLHIFDASEKLDASFHLVFLFQLTKFLGFYPRDNFNTERKFFNPDTGYFSEIPFSSNLEDEVLLGSFWSRMFRKNYLSEDKVFVSHKQRNLFLDSLLKFYSLQLGLLTEIKSLDIIRTVFS